MKRKAIALFIAIATLSLSTTAYAADTVQNAPTINSSGKLVIEDTDITIDSKDLTDLASVINNNATILTNVKDLSKQNETNIATNSDEYSSSKTYKEGGLCIKGGSLYQCTADIDTAEAWNDSHWKKVSLSSTINSLNTSINNMQASFQDGINIIVTAVNSKAGTSLNGTNTPEEIAEAINGLGNSGDIISSAGVNIWSSGAFKFIYSSDMVLNRGTYKEVTDIDPSTYDEVLLAKYYEYKTTNILSIEGCEDIQVIKSTSRFTDWFYRRNGNVYASVSSSPIELKIPEGIITGAGIVKCTATLDTLENWTNATPKSDAYGSFYPTTGTASDGAKFSGSKRLQYESAKYGKEGKVIYSVVVDRATDRLLIYCNADNLTRQNCNIHPSIKDISIVFIPN